MTKTRADEHLLNENYRRDREIEEKRRNLRILELPKAESERIFCESIDNEIAREHATGRESELGAIGKGPIRGIHVDRIDVHSGGNRSSALRLPRRN